jgi:crotonobetainyl-CoA:carnitine CoA-transferase CaiB-like acyl-CoA transferase
MEAVERLCQAGVPAGKSLSASDLQADEHLRERAFLRPGQHPRLGEVTYLASPIRFGSAPCAHPSLAPPLLGEHVESVLGGELGLSTAEIAELQRSGAVE